MKESIFEDKYEKVIIDTVNLDSKGLLFEYAAIKLLLELQEFNIFNHENEKYRTSELYDLIKVKEAYRFLYLEILNILEKFNYLIFKDEDEVITTNKVLHASQRLGEVLESLNEKQLRDSILDIPPMIAPYFNLMEKTFPLFIKVVKGEVNYLSALFPNGEKSYVESIYKTSTQYIFNKLIASYIKRVLDSIGSTGRNLKILEVGAGTGGTTASVLPVVKESNYNVEYFYTDISGGMLRIGKSQFNEKYDFVSYKTLNIDKDPLEQGFLPYEFDIVICSNVLHATYNIDETLNNVKKLMVQSNGYLFINEIIDKLDFLTVTFGLTDGWWLYSDEFRTPYSPIINKKTWEKLLADKGFTQAILVEEIQDILDLLSQNLFIYKT
jgi:polyketide synthase PksM